MVRLNQVKSELFTSVNSKRYYFISVAFFFVVLFSLYIFEPFNDQYVLVSEPSYNRTTHYNTKISPPGVIYKMKGGIGNQFFEYACSYAVAKQKNWTIYTYYIESTGSHRAFKEKNREFAMDYFRAPITDVIDNTTQYNQTTANDENLLDTNYKPDPNKLLRQTGYCQSPEYFKNYTEEIKRMFRPRLDHLNLTKLQSFVDRIEETESVAVHVRRGDFLRSTGFFIPISYQRNAIRKIVKMLEKRGNKKSPTFFIFSDDILHTKKKLKDLQEKFEFVYVSEVGNTSIEDFYLMMLCNHNIIPNSTFSWWAAFMNENPEKIVIASAFNPEFWKMWKKSESWKKFCMKLHGTLYHPKDWNIIDPFSGGL